MLPQTACPLPGTERDPLYPDSDGEPLAETPIHVAAIIWLLQALQDWFAGRTDVFLSANMFFYYEQGNPRKRVALDVLVAQGVGNHVRRSFRLWQEAAGPSALFEVSSEDTWEYDLTDKRELYAHLRIPEYFMFDPEARYQDPPLQGFRLEEGVSVPITPEADGSLISRKLGLQLKVEGEMLRLFDLRTGQPIPTREERIAQEKQRAEQEKQRADALAAELARLRALLPPEKRDD
jgi:Uma2 family endonuclease